MAFGVLPKFKTVIKYFFSSERSEHTNYHRLPGGRSGWKACAFKKGIYNISIYTLSDLGVLSNLIGSLSLANEHYSPPTE